MLAGKLRRIPYDAALLRSAATNTIAAATRPVVRKFFIVSLLLKRLFPLRDIYGCETVLPVEPGSSAHAGFKRVARPEGAVWGCSAPPMRAAGAAQREAAR
jgi:hypothetical protein